MLDMKTLSSDFQLNYGDLAIDIKYADNTTLKSTIIEKLKVAT